MGIIRYLEPRQMEELVVLGPQFGKFLFSIVAVHGTEKKLSGKSDEGIVGENRIRRVLAVVVQHIHLHPRRTQGACQGGKFIRRPGLHLVGGKAAVVYLIGIVRRRLRIKAESRGTHHDNFIGNHRDSFV